MKLGTITVNSVKTLVVERGFHDVLLGSEVISRAFTVGRSPSEQVSVKSPQKEDPENLSLELFPVSPPLELRQLEYLLRAERRLYNIILILTHQVPTPPIGRLSDVIDEDQDIPSALQLRLAWVDSGSIWTSLRSGSLDALRRLASMFQTSASAQLAAQLANAERAKTDASISQETRDATARRIIEEQERLRTENVKKTYDVWREEVRARVHLMNDLIAEVEDVDIARELRWRKDDAIRQLAEQHILPIVQNIPRPFSPSEGKRLLPPTSGNRDDAE